MCAQIHAHTTYLGLFGEAPKRAQSLLQAGVDNLIICGSAAEEFSLALVTAMSSPQAYKYVVGE